MQGLGVSIHEGKIWLYYHSHGSPSRISIAESIDGLEFEKTKFLDFDGKDVLNIKVSELLGKSILSSEKKTARSTASYFSTRKMPPGFSAGILVPEYKWRGNNVVYFGGKEITVGVFKDFGRWKFMKTGIKGKRIDVDFVMRTSQGIFLIYHTYDTVAKHDSGLPTDPSSHLIIKAVFFDPEDPSQIIWETKSSLWHEPDYWKGKKVNCLGFVYLNGKLISYWDACDIGMFLIQFPVFNDHPAHEGHHYKLNKHFANPILSPTANAWENEATFNPAVFQEDGKVYMLYRALGHGYLSVLGYAESEDGIKFKRPFKDPIYTARESFEKKSRFATPYSINKHMSAGGIAGCEDPRITKIGDRLYMIYVAFNGWEGPRLALTSILYEDFLKHHFLWEKPVLISPPGVTDKSGCLLPEKINGKYVIFHRVFPDILIDFVDDLLFDGTKWLSGEFKIHPRPTMWDSRKIGAGAPPIKTPEGWLLIYQGVTDNDSSKYKVGAMLLDLNDPTKVLHRSIHPIIEPTEHYENNLAKFGVVYPCGAVVVHDTLMVYYGGSDTVTCVATANLSQFLKDLTSHNEAKVKISI